MKFLLIALCLFSMQGCAPERKSVKFPSNILSPFEELRSIAIIPVPNWPVEYQLVNESISFDTEETMSFVFGHLLSAKKNSPNHPSVKKRCLMELYYNGEVCQLRLAILTTGEIIYFSGAHCFEIKDHNGAFRSFLETRRTEKGD